MVHTYYLLSVSDNFLFLQRFCLSPHVCHTRTPLSLPAGNNLHYLKQERSYCRRKKSRWRRSRGFSFAHTTICTYWQGRPENGSRHFLNELLHIYSWKLPDTLNLTWAFIWRWFFHLLIRNDSVKVFTLLGVEILL